MNRIVLALIAALVVAAPVLAAGPPPPASAWRPVDAENTLVIDTNQGRIIVELTPQTAPATVDRIKTLTRQKFYDGLSFFRVIDDFMDQTGDPKNTGEGASSLPNLQGEFNFKLNPATDMVSVAHRSNAELGFIGALPVISQPAAMAMLLVDGKVSAHGTFCPGVLGMARAEAFDSGNSQFFLMRGIKTQLDGLYAAVGRVVVGEDVVRAIKTGEPAPPPQDTMLRVQVMADMPEGVRPTVRVIDTKSPYFLAQVAKTVAAEGPGFNLCDVEIPGQAG